MITKYWLITTIQDSKRGNYPEIRTDVYDFDPIKFMEKYKLPILFAMEITKEQYVRMKKV